MSDLRGLRECEHLTGCSGPGLGPEFDEYLTGLMEERITEMLLLLGAGRGLFGVRAASTGVGRGFARTILILLASLYQPAA